MSPLIRERSDRDFESILVLDSWNPHMDVNFRKAMKDYNGVHVVIIPGGMTPLLQPADISWNRLVKHKIKGFWQEWIETQIRTGVEPIKKASYPLIAEWCLNAWESLDREVIIKSFKYANLGFEYKTEELHNRLLEVITDGKLSEEIADHTEITDSESDAETIIETLDFEEGN